jgi:hypothetical protein
MRRGRRPPDAAGVARVECLTPMTQVLVAYASKRGSTAEIAQTVAEALQGAGLEVDCTPAADVADVAPYDAVVPGARSTSSAGGATPSTSSASTPNS